MKHRAPRDIGGQGTLWTTLLGREGYRKQDQRRLRAEGFHRCYRCMQVKPLSEFYGRINRVVNGKAYGPYHESRCKPCDVQHHREWVRSNPVRAKGRRTRENWLKKYGMSPEDYERLLALQGGKCAICRGETVGAYEQFAVDHDHETGEVRGLLCTNCNTLLGLANDRVTVLDRAIAYLASPPGLTETFTATAAAEKATA